MTLQRAKRRTAARLASYAALAALAGLAPPASARREEQCDGGVCLTCEESETGARFSVANPLPVAVRVGLEFPELDNAEPSPEPGAATVVEPSRTLEVGALRPRDPSQPYHYRFRWRFRLGDPAARHDPATRYRMPFGGFVPRRLSQGPNGAFSHRGEQAFDFVMPVGTPVLAARPGVVAWVVDRYDHGGKRKSLAHQANEVQVLHGDGSLARYVHLRRSVAVSVGQEVATGALLGHSGNTGYTTEPHLHFEVYTADGDGGNRTVPIRFESQDPAGFEPVAGSFYPPQANGTSDPRTARRAEDPAVSR